MEFGRCKLGSLFLRGPFMNDTTGILSTRNPTTRVVFWLAVIVLLCNVVLLFPAAWWWLTGTNVLPHAFVRHFDLNAESNLFAWYSSLLLTLASITALLNFVLDSFGGRQTWRRYGWLWFSAVMLFLSMDEIATIHESIDEFTTSRLRGSATWTIWAAGYGRTWILVYAPGILAVIGSISFVFMNLGRTAPGLALCALGGMTLWIISLGLEFSQTDLCMAGTRDPGQELRCLQGEVLLEESAEVFGTTGLLIAFVWYAHQRVTEWVALPRRHGRIAD